MSKSSTSNSSENSNEFNECILIWPFKNAPDELKYITDRFGGDEDWVAFVPENIDANHCAYWLEDGIFGNFVSKCNIKNKFITIRKQELLLNGYIYISYHA